MDNGLSIKPGAALRGSHATRDPLPVRRIADTELDPSKTVAAVDRDGQQRDGQQRDGQQRDGQQRDGLQDAEARRDGRSQLDQAPADVVVDPETQDRLFRERDVRVALREHPDQAMRRQRAYEQNPAPGAPHPQADIEA